LQKNCRFIINFFKYLHTKVRTLKFKVNEYIKVGMIQGIDEY